MQNEVKDIDKIKRGDNDPDVVEFIVEPKDVEEESSFKSFRFSNLFEHIFDKRTQEDKESVFFSASDNDGAVRIPKPWFFARVFLISAIIFGLLYGCIYLFGSVSLITLLLLVGGLTVPLTMAMFFYESNHQRNLSAYSLPSYFLYGGVLSIVTSLLLGTLFSSDTTVGYTESLVSGFIELALKIALIYICIKATTAKSPMMGLIIGVTIGAGYAAFESIGYLFQSMFLNITLVDSTSSKITAAILFETVAINESLSNMASNLVLRSVLTPMAYCLCCGMFGCVMSLIAESKQRHGYSVKSYYLLYAIPIVLQMLWGMPFVSSILASYYFVQVCIIFVAWLAVAYMMNYIYSQNKLPLFGAVVKPR